MAREKEYDTGLYVVVCSKLHNGVGPFTDAREALKAAKSLTEKYECVYIPIPLIPTTKIIRIDAGSDEEVDKIIENMRRGFSPREKTEEAWHGGQYL